jgi:hypothetical protein
LDRDRQDRIEEGRAAILLGLSTAELRRLSRLSGLGRLEKDDRSEQIVFTYDELRRLCLLAAPSPD